MAVYKPHELSIGVVFVSYSVFSKTSFKMGNKWCVYMV